MAKKATPGPTANINPKKRRKHNDKVHTAATTVFSTLRRSL